MAEAKKHASEAKGAKGCGKKIKWADCPRVEKEVIEKIFETEDIDALVSQIVVKDGYKNKMKEAAKSVDLRLKK